VIDCCPYGDGFLKRVVVVVLGDGLEFIFVLLVDEGDGYGFGWGKVEGISVNSVARVEDNIADGNNLYFFRAFYL